MSRKRNNPSTPQKDAAPEGEGRIVIPTLANTIQNGFADALGFNGPGIGGNGSTVGFPGFGAGFGVPAISDAASSFENLRWYLISNFRQLLSQLYVEIGLVKTVCVVPVDDGLRGGVMFKSKQLDEQQLKDLQLAMKRDGDIETCGQAAKWTRLYGGGGILILVDDQDPEQPLDLKKIGPKTKVIFRAVDMWELYWDKQNVEGYDAEIQSEEFDYYNYYNRPVHKSRVMKLKGIEAPSFIRPRLRGWGVSVVEDLIRSMNQYLKATDLGYEVLDEFKLDVYKIKNLVNTLLTQQGTNKIKERIQMAQWQKNYQNAIVMDAEDEFDHKQLSFAGLAEAMEGIRSQVAADMRMPVLKLFGQSYSKGGLGTSSSEEMENYNSMIESTVRGPLEFHILQIGQIKCQQMFGFIPDDLEAEFKPLKELSAVDQETVREKKFNRLSAAKSAGEITTLEYRDAANKGSLFDVQLDTAADGLSDDPQLADVLSGDAAEDANGAGDEEQEGEPGADEQASSKVAPKLKVVNRNDITNIKPYSLVQTAKRTLVNSAGFDKASYEADGGDDWIQTGRREIFENPGNVDESLWKKAEDASQASFGKKNWKFVTWWYKKQGGKFK